MTHTHTHTRTRTGARADTHPAAASRTGTSAIPNGTKAHNIQVISNPGNGANVWWGAHCLDGWMTDPSRKPADWDVITFTFVRSPFLPSVVTQTYLAPFYPLIRVRVRLRLQLWLRLRL